jgi:superfamily II DNA/RNA helicase
VKQAYFAVERWDKKRLLVHLLQHEDPALTLVFCRTKQTVDGLTEYLIKKGFDALAIHGDMYQSQRNRVMQRFRRSELKILVASDLAARGLDVDNITHVVNYDLPEDPEVYVHRVGRTARAGRAGEAWSFVSADEGGLLGTIEQLANVEIPRREYPDFVAGPVPADVTEQRHRDKRKQEEHRVVHSRVALGPPSKQGPPTRRSSPAAWCRAPCPRVAWAGVCASRGGEDGSPQRRRERREEVHHRDTETQRR